MYHCKHQFTHHPWIGVGYKILACTFFALVNGLVRALTGGASFAPIASCCIPYAQLAFLEYAVGAAYMLPFQPMKQTPFKGLYCLYVLSAVSGTICWYGALSYMPIFRAIALNFTGPIFTILASWLILKEPMTICRVLALTLSFIGSIILMDPFYRWQQLPLYAHLLAILGPMFFACHNILGRILKIKGASTSAMIFYLLLFMVPFFGVVMLYHWIWPFSVVGLYWVWPTLEQWSWIALLSLCMTCANLSLVQAFKYADVSFLLPFGIARFILSGFVGWLFFKETPQQTNFWIGTTVLVLSLCCLGYEQRLSYKK